jgi:hypothetical protein
MDENGAFRTCCFFYFSIENIIKSPQQNWWDFLLEILHSIVNKFNFEWLMLLAKHVEKVIFLVYCCLASLQLKILKRGLELLEVGGRLVYSTCSMHPVEDEAVIADMLRMCQGQFSSCLLISDYQPHPTCVGNVLFLLLRICFFLSLFPSFS